MALDINPSKDGSTIEDNELSTDQILELLNDDGDSDNESDDGEDDQSEDKKISKSDDNKEDKDKKEAKDDDSDEEDEEEDEDKDLKLKEDEDEEEDEDLVTPVRRKEILKKYPKLFKDFPYLETSYYRDQKFLELFGTVDDAKETQQKAETLDTFEAQLLAGDTEEILRAVKDGDKNAFNKLTDNYLDVLAKVDRDAHLHVLSSVAKQIIINAAEAGRSAGKDSELTKAAEVINRHIFGTDTFTPQHKLSGGGEDKSGRAALDTERQEMIQERFEMVTSDLSTKINNVLRATVDSAIDKKDVMTEFVKKHAVSEAMSTLDQVIRSDKDFMRDLDRLWKKAGDVKFNSQSIQKIRRAYLSKAKTFLPAVIKRSRIEALKGSGAKNNAGKKRKSPDDEQGQRTESRRRSSKNISQISHEMSTLDFFNED